ncbi:MAG TPA: hypothetical protein VGQ71_06810, partial [Terriglobales bacterium]|nr:hypothetical protein [Terriglobales bacterium]
GLFLLAFAVIRYFSPKHALLLQIAALAGFLLSAIVWLLVALVTPAPLVMADAARLGARRLQERLPPELLERLPEALRPK